MPRRARAVVGAFVLLAGAATAFSLTGSAPREPAAASPEPRATVGPARALPPPVSRTPESVVRGTGAPSHDGAVTTLTITTPPFEIARRYKSMEGPYATYDVRVDGAAVSGAARELWWWKGARIEMLDEQGAPLDQEFMCHLNVDVDPKARREELGVRNPTVRILTLTQGELDFTLPDGRGLPVASDETWSMMFQVLNHNRDGLFHVRQRLVLTFVRDADRTASIAAVAPYAGSIWVPLDEAAPTADASDEAPCPCCAPPVLGEEAPSNVRRTVDAMGRTLAGHWIVPPGRHTWSYRLIGNLGPPRPGRRLYATWTHVHPFATEARLVVHEQSCGPTVVARSSIESVQSGPIGLAKIHSFSSTEGVPLPPSGSYELAVDYDNTTGRAQDSMASIGLFVSADEWTPPAWAR